MLHCSHARKRLRRVSCPCKLAYMYHVRKIKKAPPGSLAKIVEEAEEALDFEEQGSSIGVAVEIADVYLALEQATVKWGWSMEDIKAFADITRRAMHARVALHLDEHRSYLDQGRCREIAALLRYTKDLPWITYRIGYAAVRLGDFKLHVWDPVFQGESLGGVHSHAWDLKSTVLWGEIRSQVWRRVEGRGFRLNSCCSDDHCETGLQACPIQTVPEGHTYCESRGTLHEIVGPVSAVTWVAKEGDRDEAHYVDDGTDNPYTDPRPLTESERSLVAERLAEVVRKWT